MYNKTPFCAVHLRGKVSDESTGIESHGPWDSGPSEGIRPGTLVIFFWGVYGIYVSWIGSGELEISYQDEAKQGHVDLSTRVINH